MTTSFPVQVASSPAELAAVCHLRFEVYVGELKRENYSYVDNVSQILEDPLDHSPGCLNLFQSVDDEEGGASKKGSADASAASGVGAGGGAGGLTDVERQHGYTRPLPGRRVVSGCRLHVPPPAK